MTKSARGLVLSLPKGFTLIELMVAIAIIAILTVVGITVYRGVNTSVRDAKRRADIVAISKAYETDYSSTGSYSIPSASDFASGVVPRDPVRGDYFNVIDNANQGFKACAALEGNSSNFCNTPATRCFCVTSTQGSIPPGSTLLAINGNTSFIGAGLGGSTAITCDTSGTLASGLAGYWKMDEDSGASVADYSGDNLTGTSNSSTNIVAGQAGFGNARSFDGTNNVQVSDNASLDVGDRVSIAVWIKKGGVNDGLEHVIINKGNGAYMLKLDSGGYPTIGSYGGVNIARSSVAITDTTTWHHIAVTKNGATTRVYLDRIDRTSSPPLGSAILANNTSNLFIGSASDIDYFFNGLIDDVRVYNRALNGTEISLLGGGCVAP